MILSPLDQALITFFETNFIEVNIVDKSISSDPNDFSITQDLVIESLKIIANFSKYPILVLCKTGKELTGITIACLRKLQKWSYISIFEEYRRYAMGSPIQQQHEEFIETFDSERIEITSASPPFLRK